LLRRRLKARDSDTGDEHSVNSYLGQRQALSRNISSLHPLQRLYIPGSAPFLDAVDTVLLADHPENVTLWLPSALPSALRDTQCVTGLPQLEYRLRYAQATNALHDIRNFRRLTRILVLKTQSHIANTQRTATRARGLFDKVKLKLTQAISTYRVSRKAIESLSPNEEFGPWKGTLLELQDSDIRGPGREGSENSESRFVQSWIWTTASQVSASADDTDLQAALRVEWCKAQERARRYEEEKELIVEEMRRTLVYLEWNAQEWESSMTSPSTDDSNIDSTTLAGVAAYANKQADIRRRMSKIFIDDWFHLLNEHFPNLPWLKKHTCPPATKRNRLISNVKRYHSYTDTSQTDVNYDEVVSDDVDDPDGAIAYSLVDVLDHSE